MTEEFPSTGLEGWLVGLGWDDACKDYAVFSLAVLGGVFWTRVMGVMGRWVG
jgi:hypothetical protein